MGVYSCLTSIIKNEGYTGLYKGMSSPLVGVAVINSCLFAVYGSALRFFSKDIDNPTVMDICLAGSFSGFVNGFLSSPMELVKIRLQNQSSDPKYQYKGPIDCVQKIIKMDGLRGLYKGFGSTLLRETPSYGAYFASYEILCRMIPDVDPNQPSLGILFAGGFAGILGWLSTYPVDVVKTRLQSLDEALKPKYKNTFNGLRLIAREEGVRVLFAGMGATAIRAFPTNAATFYAVATTRNFLHEQLGLS
ncbi:mitochondrial carrier domain-containing protein [Globomyces pollinis-pini]|nr:mitochondrial carrier domain-containing protein [Globomyces pollinis-pini]